MDVLSLTEDQLKNMDPENLEKVKVGTALIQINLDCKFLQVAWENNRLDVDDQRKIRLMAEVAREILLKHYPNAVK